MDGHRLRGENCVLVSGLATPGGFGAQVHSFFYLSVALHEKSPMTGAASTVQEASSTHHAKRSH
jgi:hypothetical protein